MRLKQLKLHVKFGDKTYLIEKLTV